LERTTHQLSRGNKMDTEKMKVEKKVNLSSILVEKYGCILEKWKTYPQNVEE
jgi:hypothetical protein